MRTFRDLMTSALLVGAAFVLLPAASAHPINTECGTNRVGVYAYPGVWESHLSTDPNNATSGMANVYIPYVSCQEHPYPMPCLQRDGWGCSTAGNHIAVPFNYCGLVPPPTQCGYPPSEPLGIANDIRVDCETKWPVDPLATNCVVNGLPL